ncbi:hypothetical protein F5Y18DRAFT_164965 [Xylariaceae sp. FL1019]|nr:hypothetical protein F5Y18DRAFT_164965 [Xylariaceae sp. FL1019]
MMSSMYGADVPHISPPCYNDAILDELSRHWIIPEPNNQISRPSNGQRQSGVMRVVKPRSANNSPQSMQARRRTLWNDNNIARRRQHALDQANLQHVQDNASCYTAHQEPVKRSHRPVSWHPSSHHGDVHQMQMQIPQANFSQYMMPMPTPYHQKDVFSGYQTLPPTPAVYSEQTSPISGISPISHPFGTTVHSTTVPAYVQLQSNHFDANESPDFSQSFPTYNDQTSYNWNTYLTPGLQSCTAPPTPDEFQTAQQIHPIPSEESIPYQPLEESEDEGEILVGMGLYDSPSKVDNDPTLDHYRRTTSQLLGATFRSGQGWKLEESWEPPASDDDEGDEDAEAEE